MVWEAPKLPEMACKKPARGQQEAKRPARGKEASQKPARGQQQARGGQEEAPNGGDPTKHRNH